MIKGKRLQTHRLAYTLANGPIPDGMYVCHRCDNPPCCRPDHLFLGTQMENMADMRAKRRGAIGERSSAARHPERIARGMQRKAKLTDAQVIEIRRKWADGATMHGLAELYGVSYSTVNSIVHRRKWTHLP